MLQGAYGHMFTQISERAIARWARRGVVTLRCLASWAANEDLRRLLRRPWDGADRHRAQTDDPWFAGWVTRYRWSGRGCALHLAAECAGEGVPFSTNGLVRTQSGRGELVPVPVFTDPAESRAHAAGGDVIRGKFLPRKADKTI